MNRDTLCSVAVGDTSAGATITVPDLRWGRNASVYLVDNAHCCRFVSYEAGRHALPTGTRHLGVGVRIKVFDPGDADEIALVNLLHNQFSIKAGSAEAPRPAGLPAEAADWDQDNGRSAWRSWCRNCGGWPC
jgi:hypothetical protein